MLKARGAATPLLAAAFISFYSLATYAADPPGPVELGLQVTGVHLHKIDETPFGFGARVFVDLHRRLSPDSEVTHYLDNPAGNFGETSALFVVRSGKRWDRFGAFGKVRAGVMHFGGADFDQRLERKNVFDAD